MRRIKLLVLAGCSASLVLAPWSVMASGDFAVLREPVVLPMQKDGKRIGETKIPAGARVAVPQIRLGMVLVSRPPAEPVWVREESLLFDRGSEPEQSADKTESPGLR